MIKSILTAGALNLDVVVSYRKDDHGLPMASWGKDEEREVADNEWWHIFYSYLSGRRVRVFPGGSAANAGAALAALDRQLQVRVVGVIGEDAEANHLQSPEHWHSASCDFVSLSGLRTGRALSYVGPQHQGRRIAVAPGANNRFSQSRMEEDLLRNVDWMHASSFVTDDANRELADLMRRIRASSDNVKISLDPGTFLSQHGLTDTAKLCIQECDYVLTKTSELLALTGLTNAGLEEGQRRAAVDILFALSTRPLSVVVERIPNGYTVYRSDRVGPEQVSFPGHKIQQVKDDTGAGDVFDAGFIYSTLQDLSPIASARLIQSMLRVHLRHFGRGGYHMFSTCTPRVFVSHSSKDKRLVNRFVDMFSEDDVTFWIDESEIPLGSSLTREIMNGVRSCDFLMLAVTPDSVQSGWVQRELEWAAEHQIRTVPVVLAPAEVPTELENKLYLAVNQIGWATARERFLRECERGRSV